MCMGNVLFYFKVFCNSVYQHLNLELELELVLYIIQIHIISKK